LDRWQSSEIPSGSDSEPTAEAVSWSRGMQDELFIELGWKHRNGIATTLALVDEALCEFEQWGLGREIKG
jgi:hypothetical protein